MTVHFEDVAFDESRRLLFRGDQPQHISPKAFQLLAFLIAERPRALPKEELQERLWPDAFVTEGNIASLIAELRSALGDDARKPRYIRTHHAYGYSFAATVVFEEPPAHTSVSAGAAVPAGPTVVPTPLFGRRTPLAALALAVLTGLAVGAAWFFSGSGAQANLQVTRPPIRSIAVLPFHASGLSTSDSHLGFGMADLIITRLSNVHELTVRPTSAVRGLERRGFDSREVGRRLKVDGVLEGSIRAAGDRVRVTVQLFDVNEEKPIWAERFDETKSELFTIEDGISSRVADALLVRLTSEEKAGLAKKHTNNAEAYQLYIQGRYHFQQAAGGPSEAPQVAAKFFSRAVEKDPRYAPAWAGLADAHWAMATRGTKTSDYYAQAEKAARRALELDPRLPDALVSMARVRMYWHLDYAGARRELQRALAIQPRHYWALAVSGYLLQSLGQADEAHEFRTRLVEVDPLHPTSHWSMANGYLCARRYDLARKKIDDVLAMDPKHFEANLGLVRVLLMERKPDPAVSHAQKVVTADRRPRSLAFLGHALGVSGRKAEAQQILEELHTLSRTEPVAPFDLALVHIGLGDHSSALALLEKALEDREYAVRLKTEVLLDPLRDHPRFAVLLRRAGFKAS